MCESMKCLHMTQARLDRRESRHAASTQKGASPLGSRYALLSAGRS